MPKRGKSGWKDDDGCHLVVVQLDQYGDEHLIAWFIPEDGDVGGAIGECESEQPHKEICRLAKENGGKKKDGRYLWPGKRAADVALRAINAGMLAWEAGKPLPEWAIKAAAEGWTPPKGWTP